MSLPLRSAFLSTLLLPLAASADWPQILGPQRNGQAAGETLLDQWPEAGPKKLWSQKLGEGYAGPAVAGDRVVVFHRVDNSERVQAFDAATGRSLWKTDFSASYSGGYNPDRGPRCVPLIHKNRVYVFGAAGDLHAVDLADGRKVWSYAAYEKLSGLEGYFGAGSTPIVADEKLLVNVGGRNGAGLAAFSLKDGKLLWKVSDENASYSSPTQVTIDGQQHVIFVTRMNAVSVDPKTGAERFRFPFGQRGPTVNAATPLVFNKNLLFVTASYRVGGKLARIDKQGAKEVWADDETLSSQYATAVYHRGHLYGCHGREDIGVAAFRCVEAATGKVKWSEEGVGVANVILAGDRMLLLTHRGELMLAEASPEKFRKLAATRVASEVTRALPALSGGKLYLRSNGSDNQLVCLQVGK